MKNFFLVVAFLLNCALCFGDTAQLEKAITAQDLNQVKQILKTLGTLSLYNKRVAEEMALTKFDNLQKADNDNSDHSSLVTIISTMLTIAAGVGVQNVAKCRDECLCVSGVLVLGGIGIASAISAMRSFLSINDPKFKQLLDNAEKILQAIKDTPTA